VFHQSYPGPIVGMGWNRSYNIGEVCRRVVYRIIRSWSLPTEDTLETILDGHSRARDTRRKCRVRYDGRAEVEEIEIDP
jgi:hypothetical protein